MGGDPTLLQRLDLKDTWRCANCNASFFRLNVLRTVGIALLIFVCLGGVSYMALRIAGPSRTENAVPRLRKGQVPEPPPPVFR